MQVEEMLRIADQNVYGAFAARFAAYPERLFIENVDGQEIRYGDVDPITARMARLLAQVGVTKGSRVAGVLSKSAKSILLYLAACRLGAVYIPIHNGLTPKEIAYIFADAGPVAVVCDPAFEDVLAEPAREAGVKKLFTLDIDGSGTFTAESDRLDPSFPIAPCSGSEPNSIVYTSGTTGQPKGAILTNGLVTWNALAVAAVWKIAADDVLLHANPMAYGLFGTTMPVLAGGARMILLPKFEADDVIARLLQATVFAGVPTYYSRLLARTDFDAVLCRNMRLFITGSAPMRADTFQQFRARTGHVLLDRYGLTEALLVTSNLVDSERRPDTSGLPLPGSDIRVVDENGKPVEAGTVGMIEIKQPYAFLGYWKAPEKTKSAFRPDGYFITGDFGRLDKNGYISVLGRGADLIITGGLNVYPKEVEAAINQTSNIVESAVIGVPHPDFGEAVVAVVQLADKSKALDKATLVADLKTQIASYKVPKYVEIIDEMPRNTLGKIQKNLLKNNLRTLFQPEVSG